MPSWKSCFLDTPAFDKAQAFSLLEKLAVSAIDLTQENILTPERITSMKAEGAGFTLLYGFERVTDKVMAALFSLAMVSNAKERPVLCNWLCCTRKGQLLL